MVSFLVLDFFHFFFFLLNMVYLVEMYLKTSVVLSWMVSFFFFGAIFPLFKSLIWFDLVGIYSGSNIVSFVYWL